MEAFAQMCIWYNKVMMSGRLNLKATVMLYTKKNKTKKKTVKENLTFWEARKGMFRIFSNI